MQAVQSAAKPIDAQAGSGCFFQERFHQRWSSLRDPHVRALVWLLTAPDLLDIDAPCWNGRIATLGLLTESDATWLQALDSKPQALYALINSQPSARLGHYAEKLLIFYLQQTGRLIAHNVQVRNGPHHTIGEFDFLVHDASGTGALHWEFATKFYLLASLRAQRHAHAFVGPNLSDSLDIKVDKIMRQQLLLSRHPAAAQYLAQPVTSAQALLKGWLFYPDSAVRTASLAPELGLTPAHCRGFWCLLSALHVDDAEHYLILPRLTWLAPARAAVVKALSAAQLHQTVASLLAATQAPVMIAVCYRDGDDVLERSRGFVVPPDWPTKAAQRVQQALLQY